MYVRYALACVLLTPLCSALPCYSAEQSGPPPGITVTGTGEVQGKPDVAFITLGVQTEDKEAAKAAQDNATKNTAVIDAITKAGVSKSDIQTISYSVSPNVDYQRKPPARLGYTVSNEVRVKLRNLARVGAVIDAALGAGANYSQSLVFAIDDDTPLRKEALAQAALNAQAKAKAIADALGVKLDVPLSIVEASGQAPPVPLMRMSAMETAPSGTPILPGENRVSASVTIQYSVRYQ